MHFSELLHGFVKIDTWISLSYYMDLSKLIHGFLLETGHATKSDEFSEKSQKNILQILDLQKGLLLGVSRKLQYNFLKMRGWGGGKDRLESFRNIICFGSVTRPLDCYDY